MNRDQMMELVKSSGMPFDQAWLDSLSDEQLAGLIACLTPKGDDAAGTGDGSGTPPANVAANADDDPDKNTAACADGTATPAAPAAPAVGQLPVPTAMTIKFRDFQTSTARIEQRLNAADRLAAQRLNAEKDRLIDAYWAQFLKAEVRVPSQEENTKRALRRCDAVQLVAKFADMPDAGPMTELDYEARRILAEPKVVKFGEKMPQDRPAKPAPMTPERQKFLLSQDAVGRAIVRAKAAAAAS
jgi:hypothetical protein